MTNEIQDNDFLTKGVEAASELPSVGTIFLGVFVTLLPKLVPRLLPMFTVDRSLDAKFDDPNYVSNGEEMFREKFSENLQMVEDIISSLGDEDKLTKSAQESTGCKRFLFSSLEALDIDVTDYIGGLEMNSIRRLGRLARGEDSLSPYYSMVADAIIGLGSILYETIFS